MAADLPRHKFTADEYQQLGRSGIFTEDDHVELLDGDIDQAKLPAYARSGIPEVWLVDLQDQVLLSHRQPVAAEYRLLQAFRIGDSIAPRALPEHTFDVESVLG